MICCKEYSTAAFPGKQVEITKFTVSFWTETANSDEVWVGSSDGVSSLATCLSKEGKDTDLVRTNNCDKPKHTETESESSSLDDSISHYSLLVLAYFILLMSIYYSVETMIEVQWGITKNKILILVGTRGLEYFVISVDFSDNLHIYTCTWIFL